MTVDTVTIIAEPAAAARCEAGCPECACDTCCEQCCEYCDMTKLTDAEINDRFRERTDVFADGARGAWTRGSTVCDKGVPTTMTIIRSTKNRKANVETSYDYNGTPYPNVRSMLEAYLKDHP